MLSAQQLVRMDKTIHTHCSSEERHCFYTATNKIIDLMSCIILRLLFASRNIKRSFCALLPKTIKNIVNTGYHVSQTGSFIAFHFQGGLFNEFNFLMHKKCDNKWEIHYRLLHFCQVTVAGDVCCRYSPVPFFETAHFCTLQ